MTSGPIVFEDRDRLALIDLGLRRLMLQGLVVVGVLFGGLFIWSAVVPLESAVLAPGSVQVSGANKTVQHLEGGIVKEILVEDGDVVEVGQPLIRLDTSGVAATLASLEAQLFTLAGEEARLLAERDGRAIVDLTPSLKFLQTLKDGERRILRAMTTQQAILDTRTQARETDVQLLSYKIDQQGERVEGLKDLMESNAQQILILEDELSGLEALFEKGHAPKSRMLALKREKERLTGQQASHKAEIAQIRTAMAEGRLQISRLETDNRESVLTQLKETQLGIEDIMERRQYAADQLSRTEIVAPYAGQVFGVNVHAINGVIGAGAPLLSIVPGDEELVMIVRISPSEIDRVHTGDSVRIRFPSLNASRTPEVKGTLKTVSADVLVEQDGIAPYYRAVVELSEPEMARVGTELTPGMQANAMIQTGQRTALSYLTKPLADFMAVSFKEE
ncbi:HlyD family type I secretion periplasmic adaptor subunit [Hyphomonas sp.]|uniref:HlyD family type I secretion periplasmic adaptor subunit n=1 Tax=Hyphomonas sp. TaxID=87 RepID=UPI0030020A86|eukprot:TRINITY_DN11555_c0_g1_i1.p2 TRINITY_DN11555_c0_g1~~TRINITY_DN11555_c0_g1_i1.p2  ORF type:complete len:448 (+),score=72.55 TRINITY_DN11555_c0_g1_i1:1853-3196(+)